ncbi:MAG TPA: ABC transporter permease, partial [Thermoanaerobaculia bacterium]|nr:ABC transporter permease [Thermoanaerobaculia bacterium]
GVKEETQRWPTSYPDFVDLRQRARSLEGLAVRTENRHFKLREPEGAALIGGEMVSANYFEVLGVRPAHGRGFLPDEDRTPGGNPVAILSDGLWHRAFGADPGMIGSTVELNELLYTVVGVMPAGFRSSTDGVDVWLPISMATTISPTYLEDRAYRSLTMIGRLRQGITVEDAQKELSGVAEQLAREYPDSNEDIGVEVLPLRDSILGNVRPLLWTLLGGSAFVLLISCTNIANLLLAKAVSRQREISLRVVLGAGRRRLIRQLLTESAFLGILGCILGLLVASLSVGLIVRMSGSGMSGSELRGFVSNTLDPLAVVVILVVSIFSGLLFGLAPALFASRTDSKGLMSEGARNATAGTGSRRLQGLLIVGEVALAVALLVGVGLMTKSFWQQSRIDLGFKADHLLTLRMYTQSQRVATPESLRQVISDVLARVEAVPGVSSVAVSGPGMPTDEFYGLYFELEGRRQDDQLLALRHHVSPGYFSTLAVPLLRGRVFTPQDTAETTPVVVVSNSLAKQFWPGQDPIGKRLKAAPTPWLTVVGVVADVRQNGLSEGEWPAPDLYLPALQLAPRTPPVLNLLVRTSVPPDTLGVTIQRELKRFIPELPVYEIMTMEARLSDQMANRRLLVLMMGLFSLAALLLAAVGIYGVTSYAVSQRTREFGIRLALGAQPREVIWAALARGFGLALTGLSLGLIAGLALTRLIKSQLLGTIALDPILLASTVLVLLVVTLVANYIPARRAVRADPVIALREQ